MNDTERCSEKVYPQERWGAFHPHRCKRKIWKDGVCRQHHPESKEEREKKSMMLYEKKRKRTPEYLLMKARERIEELEKELAEFRKLKEQ